MFTLIQIMLCKTNDAPIPPTHGQLVHGMLFNNLKQTDPAYISSIHDNERGKPFSITPLRQQGMVAGDERSAFFSFRIGTWDDSLEQMIRQAFTKGMALNIGRASFVMHDIACE